VSGHYRSISKQSPENQMADTDNTWFDDYAENEDDLQISEYDITATPNDFNVITINSFVESGAVRIPGFQRNYVWDISRASKLIESLILGLPVPQLFLYEQSRNRFLVIDGQQRLMSIYYFIKMRFPRKEKRAELRTIFDEHGSIPEAILYDKIYFDDFRLKLPERLPRHKNKFNGTNYATLGDYKIQFDLRPIRNIIVKQNSPEGDDSSIYEVFNRLNTGGINLRAQEIRTSMYHSPFYDALYRLNHNTKWRALLPAGAPDLHMKDIEILLRGFAMLINQDKYAPSMVRFLNHFSKQCRDLKAADIQYLATLANSFMDACDSLKSGSFINPRNNRFNIALYEAVFAASCRNAFDEGRPPAGTLSQGQVDQLAADPDFISAALEGTTRSSNVKARLERAKSIIGHL
jgi:uncharacterized protein with ParB-like and HNH nuclease domain